MIILKPGSHALCLLILLLYVGEFPYRSLSLLGDKRTMMHVINRMGKEHEIKLANGESIFYGRIINVSGKDALRTIRLNAYFLPILASFLPNEYMYYMECFDDHHFHGSISNIERNHRIAETICMLLLSGINTLPSSQPKLQLRYVHELEFKEPAFYHSRELKVLGGHDLKKTQFTRIIGALFYQTGCYVVYNTRDKAMKWCGRGESKTLQMISRISSMNSKTKNPCSAILYGRDYETVLNTIKNEKEEREIMLFSDDYKMIHFLPMNQFGMKLLQVLTTPDWEKKLLDFLFEQNQIRREVGIFRYDAKVGDEFILSFLDSDMVKLYRFYDHVRYRSIPWRVICYDEQQTFLRSYMGDDVNLTVVHLDDVMEELDCKWESLL